MQKTYPEWRIEVLHNGRWEDFQSCYSETVAHREAYKQRKTGRWSDVRIIWPQPATP